MVKNRRTVEKIIIEVQKILLFDSRVSGKNKTFSDIDIAIETKSTVPFRIKRILKEKIDNLSGIYTKDDFRGR